MKKGDRVEFDHNGEVKHGVVTRAGAQRATVRLDGGEFDVKGPASVFRPSKRPVPRDEPHNMDRYEVRAYKPILSMSQETTAFTATVYRDGKPILYARNDGRGGCNMYNAVAGNVWDFIREMRQDAMDWAKHFGAQRVFEPEDEWLNWYATERPYGRLAREHFAEPIYQEE